MNITDKLQSLVATRTRKIAWLFLASCVILNWPQVLFFLPADAQAQISSAAYFTVMATVGAALFSVKDLQQTGGSKPTTPEARDRVSH